MFSNVTINTLFNFDIFTHEDFADAIPSEGKIDVELGGTPFPSSQETRLKGRSSIARLWRKAREVLEKPTVTQTGVLISVCET